MRICSLLPSATEIVFALGLGDQLVGVTHECDYPPEAARFPAVTCSAIEHRGRSSQHIHDQITGAVHRGSSIYQLDQELLEKLNPDLILTQELCEVCAVSYREVRKAVRLLNGQHTVVSLEPKTLRDILKTIKQVGELTGVTDRASRLLAQLQQRIDQVRERVKQSENRPPVLAMEWLDPPFAGGHWVPEMIHLAGGTDPLGHQAEPSAQVSWDQIADAHPEVIILMPCGFNLERTRQEWERSTFPPHWLQLTAVKAGRLFAVDGSSYFNRPGPRIVDGLEILAEILHPELFPRTHPPRDWQRLSSKTRQPLKS